MYSLCSEAFALPRRSYIFMKNENGPIFYDNRPIVKVSKVILFMLLLVSFSSLNICEASTRDLFLKDMSRPCGKALTSYRAEVPNLYRSLAPRTNPEGSGTPCKKSGKLENTFILNSYPIQCHRYWTYSKTQRKNIRPVFITWNSNNFNAKIASGLRR